MKNAFLFFVLLGLVFVSSCTGNKDARAKHLTDSLHRVDSIAKVDSARKAAELLIPKDTALDNVARFIAGLPQLGTNALSALEKDKYWIDFKTSMDENWKKMHETRLVKMQQWEQDVFSQSVNDSLKLFYPFSGPDFLHANFLYPRTKEYVMAALEPIREVPSFEKISEKDRDQFLDSLGRSLRDIFGKSYFITNHMQKDLWQIKGVLPLFYFFIERSGYEILEQKFIDIDTSGDEKEIKVQNIKHVKTPGVKFKLRNTESGKIKTVYYFAVSISNDGLKIRPGFVKFVKARGPFNTFVKSASYLMHDGKQFSTIRSLVLDNTRSLFQDDTGVPYRFFENKPEWKGTFFGNYVPPVEDFARGLYQPSLDSAFKRGAQPLPFSLGYHWSTRKQHYMLFAKSNVSLTK
ncbi:MAG: hypothetical protein OJF59_003209 [Cytophagales bacterium]|jgi:hypothetical protein|nr:hypothetical protein [Bacteroidota bacterium]MBS1982000.1 hypothetical protein [Bacteroidota bacterium]WHZ09453.1 MAG: hypothetical protein OJF59_003209 [Cytophagales bacterium]